MHASRPKSADLPDTSDGIDADAAEIDVSVLVPITERYDDIEDVFREYASALAVSRLAHEFIYIIDGDYPDALATLQRLREGRDDLKVISMPTRFGEAVAITVGFEHARGSHLLTLPAYRQIEGGEISRLLEQIDDADMVVASRSERADSRLNRIQTRLFSALVNRISGLSLTDAGCNVRLFRRGILEEVNLYGDFHRFFPILAHRQGFTVREVALRQSEHDQHRRIYRPGLYLRRLLDLLAVYFLLRFTKKPFRFFGLIGSSIFLLGTIGAGWVIGERLFLGMALADRPAFLLSTLLMVFGLQILSVGLIGEIIIFSHAKDLKEYSIKRVIGGD